MTDLTSQRQQAHALLDQLPPAQLNAVRNLLQTMLSPVSQRLAQVPIDDESFTDEERQAVAESEEWLKKNEPIPLETVLADLGLTKHDWDEMSKSALPDEIRKGG
jgi:hypothetical protein